MKTYDSAKKARYAALCFRAKVFLDQRIKGDFSQSIRMYTNARTQAEKMGANMIGLPQNLGKHLTENGE